MYEREYAVQSVHLVEGIHNVKDVCPIIIFLPLDEGSPRPRRQLDLSTHTLGALERHSDN